MASLMGKHKIAIDTTTLADGDSLAAYLTDAAGALITSTLVGAKQSLDALTQSEHLDGTAYAAGTDYLSSMGAVDESGNWLPLNINAAGELLVNAAVTFTAEHLEDSAAGDGFSGIATLLVRQDVLATSTSDDDDFGAFKSNALGELYVHDTSVLAQLVTITGATHAEDSASASGDLGIFALSIRRDAAGASNAGTTGDYAEIQTWSNGELKTVDISNETMLQQQVSVTNVATALPTVALARRKSIMIQNTGTNKLYVGSATVTSSGATTGIEFPANSFMELEVGPAVPVYAIKVGATGNNVNVLELA